MRVAEMMVRADPIWADGQQCQSFTVWTPTDRPFGEDGVTVMDGRRWEQVHGDRALTEILEQIPEAAYKGQVFTEDGRIVVAEDDLR